jgi:hypothetical protein
MTSILSCSLQRAEWSPRRSTSTSVPTLPIEVAEEAMALCVAAETEAFVVDVEEVVAIKFHVKSVASRGTLPYDATNISMPITMVKRSM